jgi:superoxide dismutase, Cu-Zn family
MKRMAFFSANSFIASSFIATSMLATGVACAQSTSVTINKIDISGVGEAIGTLTLEDSPQGLKVTPNLKGLPPGPHGFHIHANPSCAPGDQNGQRVAGLGAGGHFDPANTGKHLGPAGDGHKGDMPVLVVDPAGAANQPAFAPHLKRADASGHAIVIHAGGDNYSDQPAPLGGGGARIACGIVK